eukprot:gene46414-4071_t
MAAVYELVAYRFLLVVWRLHTADVQRGTFEMIIFHIVFSAETIRFVGMLAALYSEDTLQTAVASAASSAVFDAAARSQLPQAAAAAARGRAVAISAEKD